MIPELQRLLPIDRISATGLDYQVKADATECAALARRLDVPGVAMVSCDFRLRPAKAGAVIADGRLRSRLTRVCVVSLDDFQDKIDVAFRVRFVPSGAEDPELDPESDDEIPYDGNQIDLGEACAEQLALVLDPYPRKPGAILPEEAAEDAASPFAALARLKRPS
jgi:uncharacterized metal-binding protein YceD (DUF177 family)